MKKYTVYIHDDNKIQLQRADYIEDGWYIDIIGGKFLLYDITQYGGNEEFIEVYDSLISAIEKAESLT